MIMEDVIKHEGAEWVSIKEFCERLNAPYPTVTRYIREGRLQAKSIKGSKAKYLRWDIQSKQYTMIRENPPSNKMRVKIENPPEYKDKPKLLEKRGRGRPRKEESPAPSEPKRGRGRPKKEASESAETQEIPKRGRGRPRKDSQFMPSPKELKSDSARKIEIPSIIDDDFSKGGEIIDLSKLDPTKYPDCWYMHDGEPLRDSNDMPLLDYVKLQNRLKAEKWAFDLDKDKGEYVAKADVIISIQNIVKLIEKGLDTIPGRYTSRLLAETRRITDHEFTDEERTVIRSHLKNVASEIMKSLQVDIKNLIS